MEEEEEEKKLMREVKWGLKLLGASAWSRLTVMEGVRCGRQEHLARGSLKTRQAGEFLWIISRKCDVFEKAKLKSH
jgi:hypothetical protein